MSESSRQRSAEFLALSDQFRLGGLTTESSHPVTAQLSEMARQSIEQALELLFKVDEDVLRTYSAFRDSGRAGSIARQVADAVRDGGKLFFTGCGSTGRLSIQLVSIWRDFWQKQKSSLPLGSSAVAPRSFADQAFAVMAGGDFALIKAVEGFEDYTEFGRQQIGDLGVSQGDVVFAITEGGETSFVIGTAWRAVEAGAKTYFVYNNPDDVLCRTVQRSREIIQDSRIEKLNLTTGAMAITGSTRMQATSIQLAVLLTILEMAVRDLLGVPSETVPVRFEAGLRAIHRTISSATTIASMAELVKMEETIYRSGRRTNYYADAFGIDVLTDTTERSPTYCTPPFRKFDDYAADESWAFLFVPAPDSTAAWRGILKRDPRCIEWTHQEVESLLPPEKRARTLEILKKISCPELMRFRVGVDGIGTRPVRAEDGAIGILSEVEIDSLRDPNGFFRIQLEAAQRSGGHSGLVYLGTDAGVANIIQFLKGWPVRCQAVLVGCPKTDLLLDGVTRVGLKMMLNALSTCTMVRLGRVMGNYMIWVVASNLKLIDRATRYIERLTGISYTQANELLFEVLEFVEPRMKSDQAYPPVVGLAVMRARHGKSNEDAEQQLWAELRPPMAGQKI